VYFSDIVFVLIYGREKNNEQTVVLPVKVGLAQDLAVPAVALVGERAVTVGALHAFRVPRPVQHVQKELIHYGFVATRATHHQTAAPAAASAWKTCNERVRRDIVT